jgi:phosphoglucosamine mutase
MGRAVGRVTHLIEAAELYASFACKSFPNNLSLSGIKIVVDAANGAAYQTTPLALTTLGAIVDLHFASPDGWNINEKCGSTHPDALSSLVKTSGATVGLAHDGDADRLLFCDETGAVLDGDDLLAMSALDLLSRDELKSRTLVTTTMSNFGLAQLMNKNGGKILQTDVGDRHVIDAMVKGDFNLGGEQSGHLIYRDFTTTGDGLIAALQILSIISRAQKPLSELCQVLQKLPQVQRNVPVKKRAPISGYPALVHLLAASEARLSGKGRILLRYSGTEPKIRLLLEGPDPATLEELADDIVAEIDRSLGE